MAGPPGRVGELEAFKQKEIVVHCHHGGRSLKVTHWLRGQGFANVKSMAGGIDLWAIEIVPKRAFYDYAAKYEQGMSDHFFPARIPEKFV